MLTFDGVYFHNLLEIFDKRKEVYGKCQQFIAEHRKAYVGFAKQNGEEE